MRRVGASNCFHTKTKRHKDLFATFLKSPGPNSLWICTEQLTISFADLVFLHPFAAFCLSVSISPTWIMEAGRPYPAPALRQHSFHTCREGRASPNCRLFSRSRQSFPMTKFQMNRGKRQIDFYLLLPPPPARIPPDRVPPLPDQPPLRSYCRCWLTR